MAEPSCLAEALAMAQGEFPEIPKDGINPHRRSRYATLDAMVKGTRAALSKYGLAVSWSVEDGLFVAMLHWKSEKLRASMPYFIQHQDMQGVGTMVTYARRYTLGMLLNITADEDDDGNAASAVSASNARPASEKPTTKSGPKPAAKPAPSAKPATSTKPT